MYGYYRVYVLWEIVFMVVEPTFFHFIHYKEGEENFTFW